jgi:hypothetical protein
MAHFVVMSLAALILAAAPAPEKKPEANDPTKPVLLVCHLADYRTPAERPTYFVHAVPQTPPTEQSRPADGIHPPLLLLYTSIPSGQMKRLAASEHSAVPGPPMGIDRIHHTRTTIAGVATDATLLFVVLHTANWTVRVGGGLDGAERQKYQLLVFRLSDGEKVHTLQIKECDFPEGVPHDTSGAGPLKVVCGGVTCYGVYFKFKGDKVEQRYEKEQ